MNNEIKHEILMMYDLAGDKELIYYEAIQRIIDYIADLEQENERLKENNKAMRIEMTITWKKVDDLQKRIEKAINKLKEIKYDLDYEPWSFYNTEGKILFDLVNILNGRSDE